jgi:hypothetical protein
VQSILSVTGSVTVREPGPESGLEEVKEALDCRYSRYRGGHGLLALLLLVLLLLCLRKRRRRQPSKVPKPAATWTWALSARGRDVPIEGRHHGWLLLFFPFIFSSLSSVSSFSLDENRLREGLDFCFAFFLLYMRCHCSSGCCKNHVLQTDRIVGFPFEEL